MGKMGEVLVKVIFFLSTIHLGNELQKKLSSIF